MKKTKQTTQHNEQFDCHRRKVLIELSEKQLKTHGNPVLLTAEDWIEISCALNSKVVRLEDGEYGSLQADDRECIDWSNHLQSIMEKIGPDGQDAYRCGVAPNVLKGKLLAPKKA